MHVETPNVSVTTNDERTPLIDRTPRARVTKPAAWVWAIVMLTCLVGVIFLGVSGNLHQDMGVSGNLQDAAAVHAAGDSSDLGWGWVKKAVSKVVQFDWKSEVNKVQREGTDGISPVFAHTR